MESGIVFNIQRFCTNDGPGIRTTVFLKGCPLGCIWCHNPESQSPDLDLSFNADKCIGCGRCVAVCENGCHSFKEGVHILDRSRCNKCFKCTQFFCNALEIIGKKLSAEEVINEVAKDKIFFDSSGGGMTLSGGEPMAQFDFSLRILTLAREKGINTCIETCGYADTEKFEEIMPFVDTFLYDYKVTDEEMHKQYTGVSNKEIMKNLYFLDKHGVSIILRCPIIPPLNDTDEHFEGIIRTANSLMNIKEVNILPYHPLGTSKAKHIGKELKFSKTDFPADETVNSWVLKLSSKIKVPVISSSW